MANAENSNIDCVDPGADDQDSNDVIGGKDSVATSVVIYGVSWHTWGRAKLNFSNLIKDLIPLKTLTYEKH